MFPTVVKQKATYVLVFRIVLTVKIISLTIWFFLSHLGRQMWKKRHFFAVFGLYSWNQLCLWDALPPRHKGKSDDSIWDEKRSFSVESCILQICFSLFFSKNDLLGSFWVGWLENCFGTLSPHTIKDTNECGNWLPFWIFHSRPLMGEKGTVRLVQRRQNWRKLYLLY